MVGDPDDERQARREGVAGHRTVPHTADIRVEAWGASRERCLAEAVLGMVECFADVSTVRATGVEHVRLDEESDDDLLASLLDEVLYRLEVWGRVPVDVEVDATGTTEVADVDIGDDVADDGLDVRLAVADLAAVEITGAVPKAVSWHELHIGPGPYGWSCSVTIDA
ncbi:archease [Streptomyces phyllanthi]|uniref:Archease n=1 Tax=Streptomyces phyllanthi TaxID=1803180 RepID=A0A5N8WBR7_9ACTN|nr:archease [Streptomyces phyllanthi]MPY44911.1 archease [Streptomyces phyllanthi]